MHTHHYDRLTLLKRDLFAIVISQWAETNQVIRFSLTGTFHAIIFMLGDLLHQDDGFGSSGKRRPAPLQIVKGLQIPVATNYLHPVFEHIVEL